MKWLEVIFRLSFIFITKKIGFKKKREEINIIMKLLDPLHHLKSKKLKICI